MAELEQVARRLAGAADVVGHDPAGALGVPHQHERHARALEVGDARIVVVYPVQDHAVGQPLGQAVRTRRDLLEAVAIVLQHRDEVLEEHHEERHQAARAGGEAEADAQRLARERAGRVVGPVAQAGDGIEHTLTRVRADPGPVVEHAAHRAGGHACTARDVLDGDARVVPAVVMGRGVVHGPS